MHYYELEWTDDFKLMFEILTKFYVSMPSILDDETPRLPIIFDKLKDAYENPFNKHKQALWFDRIKEPDQEVKLILELFDKYKFEHNIDYFTQSGHKDITGEFLPHRHMPGKVRRGVTDDGAAVDKVQTDAVGEKGTEIQTTNVQFTFPYINSHLGETQWSATYDVPFLERRRFTEEEITGRYTLNTKPVLFDVKSWHQGRNTTNNEDRVLFGIPTLFNNVKEAVKYLRRLQ